jgi:hypothetical protein
LHQHQRPIHSVQVKAKAGQGASQTVEYIEATLADIELANKIAHEVLGTSLDELPPQTRRMLTQVCALVAERMRVQGLPRKEIRFTRAQLRAASASSDTQLKVHLARLAELEYLLIHRAARGQGFEYELLFDGASQDASKVLSGLIDVASLRKTIASDIAGHTMTDTGYTMRTGIQSGIHTGIHSGIDHPAEHPMHTYDAQRSASGTARSATGRGADGGVSGGGRLGKTCATPHAVSLPADTDTPTVKPSATPHAAAHTSYVQASAPASTQTATHMPTQAPTPAHTQQPALAALAALAV